jgi:hypothetical protein
MKGLIISHTYDIDNKELISHFPSILNILYNNVVKNFTRTHLKSSSGVYNASSGK